MLRYTVREAWVAPHRNSGRRSRNCGAEQGGIENMETRTSKPRETWEQAVNRLALQAQETGVKIYCHDLGTQVEFFATSVSRPGRLHRVTLFSCDCDGFIRHQRCSHNAALLA